MIAGLELLSHAPRSRLERDLVGSVLRKKIERAAGGEISYCVISIVFVVHKLQFTNVYSWYRVCTV